MPESSPTNAVAPPLVANPAFQRSRCGRSLKEWNKELRVEVLRILRGFQTEQDWSLATKSEYTEAAVADLCVLFIYKDTYDELMAREELSESEIAQRVQHVLDLARMDLFCQVIGFCLNRLEQRIDPFAERRELLAGIRARAGKPTIEQLRQEKARTASSSTTMTRFPRMMTHVSVSVPQAPVANRGANVERDTTPFSETAFLSKPPTAGALPLKPPQKVVMERGASATVTVRHVVGHQRNDQSNQGNDSSRNDTTVPHTSLTADLSTSSQEGSCREDPSPSSKSIAVTSRTQEERASGEATLPPAAKPETETRRKKRNAKKNSKSARLQTASRLKEKLTAKQSMQLDQQWIEQNLVVCGLCTRYGSKGRGQTVGFAYCQQCNCQVCFGCDCSPFHLDQQDKYWQSVESSQTLADVDTKTNNNKKRRRKKKSKIIDCSVDISDDATNTESTPSVVDDWSHIGATSSEGSFTSSSSIDLLNLLYETGSIIALASFTRKKWYRSGLWVRPDDGFSLGNSFRSCIIGIVPCHLVAYIVLLANRSFKLQVASIEWHRCRRRIHPRWALSFVISCSFL